MKRLKEIYDWKRWAAEPEWAAAQTQWEQIGINPTEILDTLRRASLHRIMYEDFLAVQAERGEYRDMFRYKARRTTRIISQGQPLIHLMKVRSDIFGGLGDLVEARLDELQADIAGDNPDATKSTFARRRPGDPWMRSFVLDLARVFRAHDQSQNRTMALIHEAFTLAGHGDRVTRDKIRHVLRQAPRDTLEKPHHK